MRVYKFIWIFLLAMAMGACSEDEFQEKYGQSKVENLGSYRTTTFLLPFSSSVDLKEENVFLIQVDGSYTRSHKAEVISSSDGKSSLVKLVLSDQERIPNGDYVISFKTIPRRFLAQVNSERIGIVRMIAPIVSGLKGEGTQENPYTIGNSSHFNEFIKMLSEDAYSCAGVFFKQTSYIAWNNNEAVMGEGLSSQAFAGHYDGGNKKIDGLAINGKNNAGIFTELKNGATVKNLKIDLQYYSDSNTGAIAGVAEGTVTFRNIKASGGIFGTTNIGGLVGVVNGTLDVDSVTIDLFVSGTENVGGIVGLVQGDSARLILQNADVSDGFVVGNLEDTLNATNVGGFVGSVDNASFEIASSSVIHTAKVSDNAIVVSGNTNVGGVIGRISGLSAISSIANTRVISPILVNTYGGGFVGRAKLGNKLTVSDCQYGGIMKQGSYIGGFFGSLDCSGKEWLIYKDNDVVASKGSDIYIGGSNYVGGVFGQLSAAAVSLAGENNFATEINGKDNVGGIAGRMDKTTMDIGSPKYLNGGKDIVGFRVLGNNSVGGAAGHIESSTLKSDQAFNLTATIPDSLSLNYKIICTIEANGSNVGGVVGRAAKSVIKGITAKSTVTNKAAEGIYTGGIVGFFDNGNKSVEHCAFLGIVTAPDYTGGIVGEINKLGQIIQCVNYGTINSIKGKYVGGIVGKINYVDDEPWVNECVNVGPVTANHFVGGIAGYISADGNEGKDWIKIARCGNYGNITASSSGGGCVGGLVGKCDTDKIRVNNGANHGTIVGHGSFKGIGGIAGSLGKDAAALSELDNVHVYECVNTAAVYSDKTEECHIGGIVGYLEEGDEGKNDTNSQVNDCYNCGKIGPTDEATHGGIIGHCDYYVSLRRCINYGDTGENGEAMIGTVVLAGIVHDSNLYHLEGTGDDEGANWSSISFTEDEMGNLSTFSGFSKDVWVIGTQKHLNDNKNRAILKNCPFQNLLYD